jgi:hypothetical protein
MPAAPLAFIIRHAAGQHLLHGGLHGEVDAKRQRLACGGVAQARVEEALDPAVPMTSAERRPRARSSRPPRMCAATGPLDKAASRGGRTEAGLADVVHGLLLLGLIWRRIHTKRRAP